MCDSLLRINREGLMINHIFVIMRRTWHLIFMGRLRPILQRCQTGHFMISHSWLRTDGFHERFSRFVSLHDARSSSNRIRQSIAEIFPSSLVRRKWQHGTRFGHCQAAANTVGKHIAYGWYLLEIKYHRMTLDASSMADNKL